MAAIPIWLVGRNTSVCNIVTQTVGANGALTPATTYTLVGLIDEIEVSPSQSSENIVAMIAPRENNVAIELGGTITLTEVLVYGTTGNLLAEAWASGNDYAIVTVTRGGNTWTFTGLMQSYAESITKGKCTGRMTLELVNTGPGPNVNPNFA
jgi:hypothetical protein